MYIYAESHKRLGNDDTHVHSAQRKLNVLYLLI